MDRVHLVSKVKAKLATALLGDPSTLTASSERQLRPITPASVVSTQAGTPVRTPRAYLASASTRVGLQANLLVTSKSPVRSIATATTTVEELCTQRSSPLPSPRVSWTFSVA